MIAFVGNNLDKIYLANSLVQAGAGYYKQINLKCFDQMYVKWHICTIPYLRKPVILTIQKALNIGQGIFIFGASIQGLALIWDKLPQFVQTVIAREFRILFFPAAFWGFFTFGVVQLINKWTESKEPVVSSENGPSGDLSNNPVAWGHPFSKLLDQGLAFTQLALSVALMVSETAPRYFAANALLNAYSFYAATKEKWAYIESSVEIVYENRTTARISLSYYCPIIPFKAQEVCAVCYEGDDSEEQISLDPHHGFHKKCLIPWIQQSQGNIFKSVRSEGIIENETLRFNVQILKENFPGCPTCRQSPSVVSENLCGSYTVEETTYPATFEIRDSFPAS